MSGILGLWRLDGCPTGRMELTAMSQGLAHRGPDGGGQACEGSVAFACQHLWVTPEEVGERQPLKGPGGILLVFDGRLDNREDLLPSLALPPRASDAACVLGAYQAWGLDAPARLNGDFALALYDPVEQRLLLARDAIGPRPLYYHWSDRLFAFASEIKALLRHPEIPTRPDDAGVADYLLLGLRPADRVGATCFADIGTLPPGHVLVVTPERRATPCRYWDFDPTLRIGYRSFGEYVEAFHERFAAAVRRRQRSAYPVAISVSGGLDSSSLFCQAESTRRAGTACPSLVGLSYVGPEGSASDERAYLEEIERAYGVGVRRIELAPLVGVAQGAELQAWHAEAPLLDSLWPITHRLGEAARSAGARRLLSGHWGDQMLYCTNYVVDLVRAFRWRTVWRHLRGLRRWFGAEESRDLLRQLALELIRFHTPDRLVPPLKRVRRILSPPSQRRRWLAPGFVRAALRSAHRSARLGREFPTAQAQALYAEVRMAYTVQCLEWNNKIAALHGLDHAFPFLDRDLVAFLIATPGEVHNHAGVPRALVREGLRDILPDSIRRRHWKADYSDPVNAGAARDLAAVRGLFGQGPRSVAAGYVARDLLEPELDRLGRQLGGSDCLAGWELTELLGLECWLRVFFPGEGARQDR